MVPKINRTPRSLRARQNQDPGGTRKDKKLPVPRIKGAQQSSSERGPAQNNRHGKRRKLNKLKPGAAQGPSLGETLSSLKRRMVKCSGIIRPPNRPFRKGIRPVVLWCPPPTGDLAEPPSLDLIYRTMVQNHEQTQRESRKMKAASRQLQLSIKKVVKSCQDIGVRIATMEIRTEELEIEVKAATAQTTTQGQQISDIQWKLEDAENRQRRNNLRILGIAEDLEGQDTRA
ncbi:hypothetical protein NDU88_004815 [Pleurodeles waltl]|uniref:Uncharacterized protein n=1 Tax=Pleurodeles waltl TaxID=8319 RepID=A0AAV7QFK2_PLEWA|nr:hypothetical protein NDU88_004815 [Pleurodeles waltl]